MQAIGQAVAYLQDLGTTEVLVTLLHVTHEDIPGVFDRWSAHCPTDTVVWVRHNNMGYECPVATQ